MVYKLQCILHAIFLCFVKKYRKILKPCLNGFKNSETLVKVIDIGFNFPL
uniref:Uncharacterized protein n=1 Tax=uncultured Desulfobacterium sp. TaxID=201089 RepID=E1YEE9_9BACT|nr:unknown protein [uncultured Desulfobacterium sp.]